MKENYSVHENAQALETLCLEADTFSEYRILHEWYEEISQRAKEQQEEIPRMSFKNNVIDMGGIVVIFPPDRTERPRNFHHQNTEENSSRELEDDDTKSWLSSQRSMFIGRIATQWREEGSRLTIYRGHRAFGGGPPYDILTRSSGDDHEDALAECLAPGNAAFLAHGRREDWQHALAGTKREFLSRTKNIRGYRLVHTGDHNDWFDTASKFFNARGEVK